MSKLIFEEESYKIIGACIEVHKTLGHGFDEAVYFEVLEKAFLKNDIPFTSKKKLELYYEGVALKKQAMVDFVCFDKIIVELNSANLITEGSKRQVVNFLKATRFKLGLLINFGETSLTWKRLINTPVTT